jgi:hypothetical protein
MIYPVFKVDSIKERLHSDVHKFILLNKEKNKTELKLETNPEGITKHKMETIINKIMERMRHFGLTEKYVDQISHLPDNKKNQLWISRTYLFYQLLIFATFTFNNESLYNTIYSDTFKFRSDVVKELPHFKIGIFGSITPTSDIDVGIQYSGDTLIKPALSYIVSRFENLFLLFTGFSSLDFDIETYADMMTIPNKNDMSRDYFYLDSNNFTKKEFDQMLKCAANSVLRNIFLAYKDLNLPIKKDTHFEKDIMKFSKSNFKNDFSPILKLIKPDWLKDSVNEIYNFINTDYNNQRYEYYKRVEIAEDLKFKYLKKGHLTTHEICEIMIAIGESLTYRIESYTCAPTVIHVVRILQASKKTAEKYKTIIPTTYCKGKIIHLDPFCTIGYYGYILSIIEQIGYMYRFHLTYCKTNIKKCKKKREKYLKRYDNAFYFLNLSTKLTRKNHKLFLVRNKTYSKRH